MPLPFFGRTKIESSEISRQGFWEFMTRKVIRFPIIGIVAVSAPMIAAAFFYFDSQTGLNGVESFPKVFRLRKHSSFRKRSFLSG